MKTDDNLNLRFIRLVNVEYKSVWLLMWNKSNFSLFRRGIEITDKFNV